MAPPPRAPPIDREKVCPFLLRCFWRLEGHNAVSEYTQASKGILPSNEMQIYTWPDATLRELTDLIQDANPAARGARTRIAFALVYPDKTGRHVLKEIGQVSGRKGPQDADGEKSLASLRFETGDYMDIAIHTNKPNDRPGGR